MPLLNIVTAVASHPRRVLRGLKVRAGRLSIAARLGLGFGLVLVLFASTTVFAVMQMSAIERDTDSALRAHTEIAERARVMRKCVDDLFTEVLLLGLSTHREDIQFHREGIDALRTAYQQARTELLAATNGGRDIAGFADAMAKLKEAEVVLGPVAQLVRQQTAQAEAMPEGEALELNLSLVGQLSANMKNEFDYWGKSLDAVLDATTQVSRERQQRVARTADLARRVEVTASAVALLIGALAGWLIARSVAVPIRHAVRAAERIARGELSFDLPVGGNDETGTLMNALSRMQASLCQLVGEVRDAAGSIETASSEVAAGNLDLSQRTEDTAARLQSTTGSVTQLSGAVRQSAESAITADSLARHAADEAQHGGQVVAQVVDSMREIAGKSRKIAEIIGVIDSIAFQTNILALNAAVEAARAGDQGRGFVVVANEVRALSQRTAAAAKDVKELILASGHSVQAGTGLVEEAGGRMEGMVGAARKVMVAIEDISRAMAAQSRNIASVSDAMNDVDRLTQQNAALVEQSAAAAESLKAQAQRLSRAVSAFSVDAAGSVAHP